MTIDDPAGGGYDVTVSDREWLKRQLVLMQQDIDRAVRAGAGATVYAGQIGALQQRGLENRIINGDFRINQRGYASGAPITPGLLTEYAHDRWRAAGYVNYHGRPSFEVWAGWNALNCTISQSSAWAQFGTYSAQLSSPTSNDSAIDYPMTTIPGVTYTVSAYIRLTAALTGTAHSRARSIYVYGLAAPVQSTAAPNAAGVTRLSVTFTAIATTTNVRLYHGHTGGTAWWDGVMLTRGTGLLPYIDGDQLGAMWLGAAHASLSYSRPVLTSYTYTQTPNGCTITLNSGGAIQQVIERENMPAGDYTLSWDGTAQARVYRNNDLTLLASTASGPLTFTTDGSDDIVVEFEAVGGTATLANVNLVAGSTAYPFRPRPMGEELALAQRYFYVIPTNELILQNPYWNVGLSGGGQFAGYRHPVPMRVAPTLSRASGAAGPTAPFSYLDRGAAAAVNYNVRVTVGAVVSTTALTQLAYSSSDNGGSNLAAGRTIGYNTEAFHASAEF